MNASELKYNHEQNHPNTRFFHRETMRYFGDTMRNYGVRVVEKRIWARHIKSTTHSDEIVTIKVYELYRKKPTKSGQESAFFTLDTFAQVFPIKD